MYFQDLCWSCNAIECCVATGAFC